MRPDIAPGRPFRDYVLPDHSKVSRRLSALRGKDDPMWLVLIRGFFCPNVDQYAVRP